MRMELKNNNYTIFSKMHYFYHRGDRNGDINGPSRKGRWIILE